MMVHHIAFTCKDPIALERYYTKNFGFQRARVAKLDNEPQGRQIVFIKLGNVYLELFQADEPSPVPPPAANWPNYPGKDGPAYPGFRHLAFKVDDVEAQLAAMGEDGKRTITLGPLRFDAFIPGWKSVWLADPEGNIVEISQGFKDEEEPPPLPPLNA